MYVSVVFFLFIIFFCIPNYHRCEKISIAYKYFVDHFNTYYVKTFCHFVYSSYYILRTITDETLSTKITSLGDCWVCMSKIIKFKIETIYQAKS